MTSRHNNCRDQRQYREREIIEIRDNRRLAITYWRNRAIDRPDVRKARVRGESLAADATHFARRLPLRKFVASARNERDQKRYGGK